MSTNNAVNSSPAMPLGGGTMTGTLTLNADPVSALQAATKNYVDGIGIGVNIGAVSNFWYPSGSIMGGMASTAGTSTRSTGTLYFHPFFVTKATIYIAIGILVTGTAAGTSVLGLYNDSGNGKPTGSPITNSNSGSITNTISTFSSFSFGSAITLSPGIYWTAHSTSGTTTFPNSSSFMIGGRGLGISATPDGTNSTTQYVVGWSQSFVYSATLPSVGSLTRTIPNGAGDAYVFLQAQ